MTRFGAMALAGVFWAAGASGFGEILPFGVTSTVVVMAVLAVLPAAFGFYTATRGRAATAWLDE